MRSKCLAFVGLCISLLPAACVNRVTAVSAKPPAAAARAAAVMALEEGDRAFAASLYDDASLAYEEYLNLTPAERQSDQVLFRLGISYALRKTNPNAQRAINLWKRLITDYPDSPAKAPAELIVSLYSELGQINSDIKTRDADIRAREERIKQLSTELERLKKIDADRRKTP
jgi:hypothetical protein